MPLVCPACRKVYLKPQIDPETQLEIDMCPKCYGMWFDTNEIAKFLVSGTLKKKFLLGEDSEPLQSVGYVMTTTARPCPRCKTGMYDKLFGDVSIDICQQCEGVWLDDGELRRLIINYKKGFRDIKSVSKQLAQGLEGKEERPSLSEVVSVFLAFLGKK